MFQYYKEKTYGVLYEDIPSGITGVRGVHKQACNISAAGLRPQLKLRSLSMKLIFSVIDRQQV